ncbi:MAG: DUF3786 domain-containing protein [Oscillospiraceae bacterium]|nr:DUF3786 domain-containing protein [Oscillospiraceae bacterium]
MEHTRPSNYDLARDNAAKQFLTYSISPMVKKYALRQDEEFTYITFLNRNYRISRRTGCVQWLSGGDAVQADFNEAMTIYDVLCYAKPDAKLSGHFSSVMQLKGVVQSANPGRNLFSRYAELFSGRLAELKAACEALGGVPYSVGDVSFQIPLFDFFPVILQFWEADEEFGAELQLKWDDNTLAYMHFETTFYAAGHLFQRIQDTLL